MVLEGLVVFFGTAVEVLRVVFLEAAEVVLEDFTEVFLEVAVAVLRSFDEDFLEVFTVDAAFVDLELSAMARVSVL